MSCWCDVHDVAQCAIIEVITKCVYEFASERKTRKKKHKQKSIEATKGGRDRD